MADFNKAYAITMGHEGAYANHPNDKGGETYKGIARKHNPDWSGWKIVDQATALTSDEDALNRILNGNADLQEQVKKVYAERYWTPNKLSFFASQELANKMFDIGVNMGIGKASRMLQDAINLTSKNSKAYSKIAVDGIIGQATMGRVNGHYRPKLLLQVLDALQGARYIDIMRNDPTQEVFAPGWFERI